MHTLLCGDVDSIVITTTYTKHRTIRRLSITSYTSLTPLARSLIL